MSDDDEFIVDLPGGGKIHLQSQDEVDRWETLLQSYQRDYKLTKINDLTQLGTLLQQHISMYRAQVGMSGMEMKFDEEGLPEGWQRVELKPADIKRFTEQVQGASKEIREIEKAMGIDAKSRSQSGDETVRDFVTRLKGFGYEYGVHISKRVILMENFVNELTWRVRLEQQGDTEDKAYEDCTPEKICAWAREQIDAIKEADKAFAQTRGRLVLGKF